jgi:hypothetical protein
MMIFMVGTVCVALPIFNLFVGSFEDKDQEGTSFVLAT